MMKPMPSSPVPPNPGKPPLRRILVSVCLGLGALAVLGVIVLLLFPNLLLNKVLKTRLERAVAATHPTSSIHIGGLHYSLWRNRFVCDSLALTAKDSGTSCQIAGLSIQGFDRVGLFRGRPLASQVLARAQITATNLVLKFPVSGYEVRCERLWVKLADAELVAQALEVRPLLDTEQFFASRAFRRTRVELMIPECRILGLASVALLQNQAYRARSIQIWDATMNAFLNRDKPANPQPHGPFTLSEALAAVPHPLSIDHLDILNTQILFRERVTAGAEPGVLTFNGVRLSAEGISNQVTAKAAVIVNARARLMNASTLELFLEIPTASPERSLRYSGSFSAMRLTSLNPFLEAAAHTRIESGMLHEAVFNINVTAGHATGQVRALYQDLQFAFLDHQTGSGDRLVSQLKSFLADHLLLRTSNPSTPSDSIKLGVVDYAWKPRESILHLLWFALRSGIFNVLGLDEFVRNSR